MMAAYGESAVIRRPSPKASGRWARTSCADGWQNGRPRSAGPNGQCLTAAVATAGVAVYREWIARAASSRPRWPATASVNIPRWWTGALYGLQEAVKLVRLCRMRQAVREAVPQVRGVP